MLRLRDTIYYENILKEFEYSFGHVYVYKGFVVSEINDGITFTWEDHAKQIVNDVTTYLNTDGSDLVYISHRIHSYAVKPNDWLNFFKNSYELKAYGVVGYTQSSILNVVIENLFFHKKIKRFNNLETAIQWATDKVLAEID
ncbi:MAG: hypothetical protein GYB32_14150 [Algicola sp.]|nr:hypothetical protein [Algicola sp.]